MGRMHWGRLAVAVCVGFLSLFSIASCGTSPSDGETSGVGDDSGGGSDGATVEMDASLFPADATQSTLRPDAVSMNGDAATEPMGTDATVSPDAGVSTDATATMMQDASIEDVTTVDDVVEDSVATDDANGGGSIADAMVESASPEDAGGGGATVDSAGPDAGADAVGGSAGPGDAASGGDAGSAPLDAGGDGACTPAKSCPAGVECGRWTDPCSGKILACGTPCIGNTVCLASPTDPNSQSCQAKACAGACGVIGEDSCGVAISCPACAAGFECVNATCVLATGSDAGSCTQLTCAPDPFTNLCGTVTDGCGHTRSCSCPKAQSCFAGVCQSEPPECTSALAALCGSIPNACGSGNVACGQCAGASECIASMCVSCTPPSCGAATCGAVNNGCGPAISCGTCPANEVCDQGSCCTPKTCAEAVDAGLVTGCGAVNLRCGVSKSCSSCPAGDVCSKNVCTACTPKTCANFGNNGCGHGDGCGNTLNCCASGTVCQGTICCAPGRVNYNGGCCEPTCDPTNPLTTQTSCGQVIYCPAT